MALRSIVYRGNELKIVNQLLLPAELKYEEIKSTEDAFKAIKEMQIRGAPAIAILAMLRYENINFLTFCLNNVKKHILMIKI